MSKMDQLFLQYMDSLRMSFSGGSSTSLETLLDDIPKQYQKGKLAIDHYIALMNTGRTYMRLLKEDNPQ